MSERTQELERALRCTYEATRSYLRYPTLAGRLDALLSALREAEEVLAPACQHEWVDARNSAVESGEICLRCNKVRAGNRTVS